MPRKNMFNTIRWRMVLAYLVITIFGYSVVLLSVSWIVEKFLVDSKASETQHVLRMLANSMEQSFAENSAQGETLYNLAKEGQEKNRGRVLVLDVQAVVQVDSASKLNGLRIEYPEVARVLWGGEDRDYKFHKIDGVLAKDANFIEKAWAKISPPKEWVVYYVQALKDGDETIGALLFSNSIQDVMASVAVIRSQVGVVLLLVVIAVSIVSYLIAHSLTQPIVQLTAAIRKMSRGEMHQRIEIKGSSEINELGNTFNSMSERLERTENFRNEFISNASHEIKTPLATMKILTESLIYQESLDLNITREFLGDINREIDRLNVVITDLLHLVQVDKIESELKRENSRLDDICNDVVKRLMPIAQNRKVEIVSHISEVNARFDIIKMQQVVFNLLDNAIKYTDEGGKVEITAAPEGEDCVIKVSDNGIGIPEKDQKMIFERFYRVDKARSRQTGGTGLGLSIVDRIVKLHGGTITVNSVEGEGTTFTVRFPLQK